MTDLKDEIKNIDNVPTLLRTLWDNSTKNAAAVNYMAGVIDGLRWSLLITPGDYDTFMEAYVYGKSHLLYEGSDDNDCNRPHGQRA